MKHLILINGLKRSGKDYTANIIKETLGEDATIISYAEPIKNIIADTFNISLKELDDFKNNKQKLFLSEAKIDGYIYKQLSDFRIILQRFGSEAMKKVFGEEIWASLGIEKAIEQNTEVVIISDFRFLVEYEKALAKSKELGFKLSTIHIYDDNLPNNDKHSSETELKENNFVFNYTIDNTDRPENIEEKVQEILSNIYN